MYRDTRFAVFKNRLSTITRRTRILSPLTLFNFLSHFQGREASRRRRNHQRQQPTPARPRDRRGHRHAQTRRARPRHRHLQRQQHNRETKKPGKPRIRETQARQVGGVDTDVRRQDRGAAPRVREPAESLRGGFVGGGLGRGGAHVEQQLRDEDVHWRRREPLFLARHQDPQALPLAAGLEPGQPHQPPRDQPQLGRGGRAVELLGL